MLRKVFQSCRLCGEKIFMPFGQLFFCVDLCTVRHCSHYINKTGTTDSCAAPENVSYFADKFLEKPLHKAFYALESYYIDRVALLCRNRVLETCLTRTKDGIPALFDNIHHSLEFADMSGKMYAKKYPDLLPNLVVP